MKKAIYKFFGSFLRPSEAIGIDFIWEDGKMKQILVVCIKRKKEEILIVESIQFETEQEFLTYDLPKNIPIGLSFNGSNVLHKNLLIKDTETEPQIINRIIPDASIKDFYLQRQLPSPDGKVLVSITRNNSINSWVEKIRSKGGLITNIILGPFSLETLRVLSDANEEEWHCRTVANSLGFFKNKIVSIEAAGEGNEYEIKSLFPELSSDYAVASSLAIETLLNQERMHIPELSQARSDFQQNKKITFAAIFGLTFIFVILLVNAFIFTQLRQEAGELQVNIKLKEKQASHLEVLRNKIQEQVKLFASSGLLETSRTSFYASAITDDIPSAILLSGLNIQPLQMKQVGSKQIPAFVNKQIIVIGNCKDGAVLNEWIHQLQKYKWVKNVSLNSYQFQSDKKTGKFNLQIDIL